VAQPTAPTPDHIDLTTLLGIDLAHLDLARSWQPRDLAETYQVSVGLDDNGQPVRLDLTTCRGIGVLGTPGSGKTELLRSTVLGLAATHSSTLVNFVLLASRASSFSSFEDLPHTAGLVGANEVDRLGRVPDSLFSEIDRRRHLLDLAGAPSFTEYQALRVEGADLPPLPLTVVAVDDLDDFVREVPDCAEVLELAQRAHDLGLVLMWTAAELHDGPLDVSRAGSRVALRTRSAAESEAMTGIAVASDLPAPGVGCLRTPFSEPLTFRAARTRVSTETGAPTVSGPTLASHVIRTLRGQGPSAHSVFLPPPQPRGLGSVLPPLSTDTEKGLHAKARDSAAEGTLLARVGWIDLPRAQRHDVLGWDLSGSHGHVAVVGRPRSGKSTTVQSLLMGLALTNTPRDLRFHCLDFGGGSLRALRDLPHTRVVASSHDTELIVPAVQELHDLLRHREKSFDRHGIRSIRTFRRRRATEDFTEAATDHVLVVDGWADVLRHDGLAEHIIRIARRGLAYGIWSELPEELEELLGGRVELRLNDPASSLLDPALAAAVPEDQPGQGVARGARCLVEPPVLEIDDPRLIGDDTVETGFADLVRQIDEAWTGDRPTQLRRPPLSVDAAELPAWDQQPRKTIAVGLGGDLQPVCVDFLVNPHLVIRGNRRAGKSTALRQVLRGLHAQFTAKEALVLVVDLSAQNTFFRYPPEHIEGYVSGNQLLAYVPTAHEFRSATKDVVAALKKRLPGKDVTDEQSRNRSWWSGPDLFVVIDNGDVVAHTARAELDQLAALLPHAQEIGLHLVLTTTDTSHGAMAAQLERAGTPEIRFEFESDPGEAVLINASGRRPLQAAWTPPPG
jgi:S-DNA-T family DNA segregation ATPase FtsK/SpoIIIE